MVQNILAVALLFLTSVKAQNLEAILSDTKLPVPIEGMPAVYDGEDSIYILGGSGRVENRRDILKFSVTTQTLEKVGTMDPVAYGTAVWTGNGGILYFGGREFGVLRSKVWSYKPEDASGWTTVGVLREVAIYTSSVWGQGEYSYIFGGRRSGSLNSISKYSSVSNISIVVGQLPGPRYGTSAVWDETTGDAYIFGGSIGDGALNDIVKFNPAEDTAAKLNATLPLEIYYSCAIWTGTEAFIIGGSPSTNGQVAIFNPLTNEVLNVVVTNLPTNLDFHGCAFVKKLNRIYLFGGSIGSSRRDEIMYIDLPPSSTTPTTTTPITSKTTTPMTTTTEKPGNPVDCNNEVCGTSIPNPSSCESYYQCGYQGSVHHQCPSQLHFNPAHKECDLPEIVGCRSTNIFYE